MTDSRIHSAESADGTAIVGRVVGDGPPLVLVHGGPHDGDTAWERLLPHLSDRFTCYLPSTRGRGRSGNHADHSPPRLAEDIGAFVASIGEPVGLVTWSIGVTKAFDAASGPASGDASVAALAVYEPTVIPVMREDDLGHLFATFEEVGTAAGDGRLVDATRAFHGLFATDDELGHLGANYFERCASVVPALIQEVQHGLGYDGPRATDPDVLARITAPVLLMRGQRTRLDTFYRDSEAHVARHLGSDPVVRELPGLGHFGPLVAPDVVADELIAFLTTAWQAA